MSRRPDHVRLGLCFMCALAILLQACSFGARQRATTERIDAVVDDVDDAPAVRAAAARSRAALAHESSATFWEGLDLRVRDLSASNASEGENIELTARLAVRNPWEVAAERRALEAVTQASLAELDGVALDVRVRQCRMAIDKATVLERATLHGWLREKAETAIRWNDERRDAGTVDELVARGLRLELMARVAAREPAPSEDMDAPAVELPSIEPLEGALDLDLQLVLARVHEHAPEVRENESLAAHYRAMESRARRKQIPWLDFAAVSYELDPEDDLAGLTGQLAIEIPFGVDHRARSKRYSNLEESARLEAESLERELARRAFAALRRLAFFESRSPRLRALDEEAHRGLSLAERWLEQRQGTPERVADVVDEVFRARDVIITARRNAGLADCDLLETMGTTAAGWPRTKNGE